METTAEQRKAIADLTIQAMMFDMDIDWEAGKLIHKTKPVVEAFWLTKWKEKEQNSDRKPEDYEGGEDDRH